MCKLYAACYSAKILAWAHEASLGLYNKKTDLLRSRVYESQQQVDVLADQIFDWLGQQCKGSRSFAGGSTFETTWSADIAKMLTSQGFPAEHQRKYPESRKSCDVVAALADGWEVWIEIKGAWLTTQHKTDSNGRVSFRKNSVFKKHLLSPTEGALKDVLHKLPLILSTTAYGAMLLIGFDAYDSQMDTAIAEFIRRGHLGGHPWINRYREFQNCFDTKYRLRSWFWYRLGEPKA